MGNGYYEANFTPNGSGLHSANARCVQLNSSSVSDLSFIADERQSYRRFSMMWMLAIVFGLVSITALFFWMASRFMEETDKVLRWMMYLMGWFGIILTVSMLPVMLLDIDPGSTRTLNLLYTVWEIMIYLFVFLMLYWVYYWARKAKQKSFGGKGESFDNGDYRARYK